MNRKKITVGILAHANAGKTTLTEQLLYYNGIIDRVGRVDDGDTVSDSMDLERARGISIRDSLVTFPIGGCVIQLIDTPGHIDFSAEVERAINVLDLAILIVSAADGIEAQTLFIWNALTRRGIPVIIFANKVDRLGANYEEIYELICKNLSCNIIPINEFYKENEYIFIRPCSDEAIMELLAEHSEIILDYYLNEKKLPKQLVESEFYRLINSHKIYPVLFGSALTDKGIVELNDFIEDIAANITVCADDGNLFGAYVYSVENSGKGRYVYAKVLQGTVRVRDKVELKYYNKLCPVKQLYNMDGKKLVAATYASAGDIVVIKDFEGKCGEYFGNISMQNSQLIKFVHPALCVKILPQYPSDIHLLRDALGILYDEEPQLNLRYDIDSGFFYVDLLGEMQAEIISSVLMERFHVAAVIEDIDIVYKETPVKYAEASASYTCVSGITLSVSPRERDTGYSFVSKLSTDFLHIKFQRQIEKIIETYIKQGVYGWELTDIEVALIGGQFDSMGSEPMHFNIITPIALFRCLKKAGVSLLEPQCRFFVSCNQNRMAAVTGSLTARKSVFQILKTGETCVISGESTVESMLNFPSELVKITSGLGSFSFETIGNIVSRNQNRIKEYLGPDPRNEVTFVINSMHASLVPLDEVLMKKKKPTRSKFKNKYNKGNNAK